MLLVVSGIGCFVLPALLRAQHIWRIKSANLLAIRAECAAIMSSHGTLGPMVNVRWASVAPRGMAWLGSDAYVTSSHIVVSNGGGMGHWGLVIVSPDFEEMESRFDSDPHNTYARLKKGVYLFQD